jgi:iron(III) transport system substrate-binding protein
MLRRLLPFAALLALAAAGAWIAIRSGGGPPDVTIYTSVDDEFAREILARYGKETGARVNVVTDTEATKTIGLVNRLREESAPGRSPRCDVFWNNEPGWTVRLAAEGLFDAYDSPAARDIPPLFKDPRGFWASNGARARIYIVNRAALDGKAPASYRDLADPAFRDLGTLARPLAGTTVTHMAALRLHLGAEPFANWFRDMAANGTAFASGNGAVAREVGQGHRAFGFTDTDDYWVRKAAGDPVEAVFPDQGEGDPGTVVLPVTVSVVKGAPHPANARRLYDWLVSPETEAALSASPYATLPVRPTTKPGPAGFTTAGFRAAAVDWSAAKEHLDAVLDLAKEVVQGSAPPKPPAPGK